METRVCKRCGCQKPIEKFTKTRGEYNFVCCDCANKKKSETWQKKKHNHDLTRELEKAKQMRLAEFQPRELMAELKRRGYEFKMYYTETHVIDSKDF